METLVFDGTEGGVQGLSGTFQELINDHLQKDEYRDRIRTLMFDHFKNDWERIVRGKYDKSQDEFLDYRRSLPSESLGGDYVKSFGEKVIANFLFEHDILYKYERNHWWNQINYRPDFTLFYDTPKPSGVIIEYFGLDGDVDYDEMSEQKRKYWDKKQNWTLLEMSPADFSGGGIEKFCDILRRKLDVKGFTCNQLTEEEIWKRVRDRFITRFSQSMSSFIGRCRQKSLSIDELNASVAKHEPLDDVESRFLELASDFYGKYLVHLEENGEEDFNGLMQRSVECVMQGETKFDRRFESGDLKTIRQLSIDEFQDFSDLFHKLLVAIRTQNKEVKLFCVGDDWQAINGFAGSDLHFFENFEQNFDNSLRLNITTNYRSGRHIVNSGNELMIGLGKKATAFKDRNGEVLSCDLDKFEPSLIEKKRHPGDLMTPALVRMIHKGLSDGLDIVMLARRNGLPCYIHYPELPKGFRRGLDHFLDHIRSFFPEDLATRIHISTSHKYKGLEKSMVIIIDAMESSYPLIHSDWVFSRVHGDNLESITMEERRLFYVALTRAIERLVVLYFGRSKSPFLREIEDGACINNLDWKQYRPFQVGKTTSLVIKIGTAVGFEEEGTKPIKDRIKSSGYRWNPDNWNWPHWLKSYPAENFTIDRLKSEPWALVANGVEVRIVDETEQVKETYIVTNQEWKKQ